MTTLALDRMTPLQILVLGKALDGPVNAASFAGLSRGGGDVTVAEFEDAVRASLRRLVSAGWLVGIGAGDNWAVRDSGGGYFRLHADHLADTDDIRARESVVGIQLSELENPRTIVRTHQADA